VFTVRTFSDDEGDLMSQLRGEKKRWARADVAIAEIYDSITKAHVKMFFSPLPPPNGSPPTPAKRF
jgi:hypothetical protein